MNPAIWIAVWAVLFVGTHVAISSNAIRPRLVAALGEQPYRGIYSLVSFATFVPLVIEFARHKHAGAMLWNLRGVEPMRWLAWILMFLAFIFFAAGLLNQSPAGMGGAGRKVTASGVLKLTRHPGFVAFSLFGFAHMLMNGFVGDLAFFASFPALGIIGGIHQDRRKEQELGDSYRELEAETSFFPGAAIVQGRQHLAAADVPWIGIMLGMFAAAVILILHPMIFGGNPLGPPPK